MNLFSTAFQSEVFLTLNIMSCASKVGSPMNHLDYRHGAMQGSFGPSKNYPKLKKNGPYTEPVLLRQGLACHNILKAVRFAWRKTVCKELMASNGVFWSILPLWLASHNLQKYLRGQPELNWCLSICSQILCHWAKPRPTSDVQIHDWTTLPYGSHDHLTILHI